MRITLTKSNDRFGFNVTEEDGKIVYSSDIHYFLVPFLKSSYRYAWEACRDGWKLAYQYPHHINSLRTAQYISDMDTETDVRQDVSAEEMLITHYLGVLRDIRRQAKGSIDDRKERKKIYEALKIVLKELDVIEEQLTDDKSKRGLKQVKHQFKKLIPKYFKEERQKDQKETPPQEAAPSTSTTTNIPAAPGTVPAAPGMSPQPPPVLAERLFEIKMSALVDPESDKRCYINDNFLREVMWDFAQTICKTIQGRHSDAYYAIDVPSNCIWIFDFDNEPILKIKVNDLLSLEKVIPMGKLQKMCPYHSVKFYQFYWKPIVESIGHFCHGYPVSIFPVSSTTLPDVMRETVETPNPIEGWNVKEKKIQNVNLSFKGKEPIWLIEPCGDNIKTAKVISKQAEQNYINAIVRCIDPQLKSIYGRTGAVVGITPLTDMIELDVDFGRGLESVTLTETQIEVVPV